jgi:hypothetical protein
MAPPGSKFPLPSFRPLLMTVQSMKPVLHGLKDIIMQPHIEVSGQAAPACVHISVAWQPVVT